MFFYYLHDKLTVLHCPALQHISTNLSLLLGGMKELSNTFLGIIPPAYINSYSKLLKKNRLQKVLYNTFS